MTAIHLCAQDNLDRDLSGKTYLIAGMLSGHMEVLATQLARQKAAVIMASRNLSEGQYIADRIVAATGNDAVTSMGVDLASLASVRAFVRNFRQKYSWLDGLINTGDEDKLKSGETEDGHGWQIGVNYLGPFLLTELMLPLLKVSAPSRIIHTSCVYHERGQLDLDDLHFRKRANTGKHAYAQAKLAVALHARHQAKILKDEGVSVFCVHIGCMQEEKQQPLLDRFLRKINKSVFGKDNFITPWQSAQTTLHCLLDASSSEHSGAYFSQGSNFYISPEDRKGGWPMKSPHPDVGDDDLGAALYSKAVDLVDPKADLAKSA